MSNTSDLIQQLSREEKRTIPLSAPAYWWKRLLLALIIYGVATQALVGVRPDIVMQLMRPLFAAELGLLALLLVTSAMASVLVMYPDTYQKPYFLKLPYGVFLALAGIIMAEFFMPQDGRAAMLPTGGHTIECSFFIAVVALVPSAGIFVLLRKGASVKPLQAGAFAVLTASALSSLTLRLVEINDAPLHLLAWHYTPTILFALIGVSAGKWLLRW